MEINNEIESVNNPDVTKACDSTDVMATDNALDITVSNGASETKEVSETGEDEPLFEARTVYDTERFMRFNISHFFKNKVLKIIIAAMFLFVTVTGALSLAMFGYDQSVVTMLIAVWVFVVIYLLLIFVVPRFTYKNSPSFEAVSHIKFYPDKMVITSFAKAMSEVTELRYEGITEVRESKGDIYLYISMNQAHLVGKDCFIKGDGERLKAYLYSRVDPKVYKCK